MDIVKLLLHKNSVAPTLPPDSTKAALLKVAEILQSNSTPKFQPLPSAPVPQNPIIQPHLRTTTEPTRPEPSTIPTPAPSVFQRKNLAPTKRVRWATPLHSASQNPTALSIPNITKLLKRALTKAISNTPKETTKYT